VKKLSDLLEIDKPREKLISRGVQSLTSHELLMVLLGSGFAGKDVSLLALEIQKVIELDKENLNLEKLLEIKGIGKAKACQVLSAFELAKRFLLKDEKKINNTEDVLALVQDLKTKKQEYFITLTLTGASTLIEKREVFKGTVNFSVVHPREIFADAISDRAAGIIFVHNHPYDDSTPSESDIKLTKQLCEAAQVMGIQVVDHIIVSKNNYFSFQTNGLIRVS